MPVFPSLAAALHGVAPKVDVKKWVPALEDAFALFEITTHREAAACIGQFLVEAGPGFGQLSENLNYTTAARLLQIFPRLFKTTTDAAPYVKNPEKLANHVYAGRLGNGDEASGDGWRYLGRGMIQITGRSNYAAFAKAAGITIAEASTLITTPDGAAKSGCWFLSANGCLSLAEDWKIDDITRKVSGPGRVDHDLRLHYSNRLLADLEA